MYKSTLRGSHAKKIIRAFNTQLNPPTPLRPKSKLEEVRAKASILYFVDGKPLIISVGDRLIPTLIFQQALIPLPKVIVDKGAIPHICKGADIMAPGIRTISKPYNKGDLVTVVEEEHGRILCIGSALLTSEETMRLKSGKAIENLHYLGDDFWQHLRQSL